MSFDPYLALNTVLPLARAAYNPALIPAGWEILIAIQPNDFGFLVINKTDLGNIIAAFIIPGTRNLEQWLWDFDNVPVMALYGASGHVHKGIQDAYSMIRTSLFAGLQTGLVYDELWVIGHSLGGALAQIFARELAMRFKYKMPDGPKILAEPVLWAFESPRPWWVDSIAGFNQTVSLAWLMENHADIVPRLPPEIEGFKTGNTVVLLQPPISTDVHANHSLDYCGQGLKKLIIATS